MNAAFLLTHFDTINDAPGSVPRLRRFIIDLAVRGKLVLQNPSDEPASDLLKRIMAEKSKLVSDGVLKKFVPRELPKATELPYSLPPGWACSRLESITVSITDGDHLPPPKTENGIPFLVIGNVRSGRVTFAGCRHVSEDYYGGLDGIRRPRKGDVLYTLVGSYGIPVMITDDTPFCVQRHIGILRPSAAINGLFLTRLLESKWVFDQATACATGIAQKTVPLAGLRKILIPLPPVDEQQRIAAKIDELMGLCDRLEAEQAEKETQRSRLAVASLRDINHSVNIPSSSEAATLYLENFDRLTTNCNLVAELQRTVLNLAVQGRLVSQESSDEKASRLLERIAAEKRRRFAENMMRREKPLPTIAKEDVPFAIPSSWHWARIGTCALTTEYGTSVKSGDIEGGVPVLAMGNIQDGKVVLGDRKRVPSHIDDLPRLFLKKFDLLYNRTNSAELVGKTGIFLGEDDAYTFASYLIRVRFINDLMNPIYCNLAMNAPYFRETQVVPQLQQQCGQANVNGTKLRNMLIPIPPLTEQNRIVSKVEELLVLCDGLEARIKAAQGDRVRFVEAILTTALGDEAEALDAREVVNG